MAESPGSTPPSSGHAVLRMLAFAIIGALAARRFSPEPEAIVIGAAFGAIAGVLLLAPLRWLLWLANPAIRKEHGYSGVRKAVGAGFATFVPFAALASMAELGFAWDALTAFAMAGFITGAAAAGIEVARLGGHRMLNILIGMAFGFGLSILWTVIMVGVQEAHAFG